MSSFDIGVGSKTMNGLASLLEEAENIVLGLKSVKNEQQPPPSDPLILQGQFRFGRPIMEPLDSCLEPTPLAPSTCLKFKAPGACFSMQQMSLSPLKWNSSPPVSLQQERPRTLMDLSFSSIVDLDDTPLSLEEGEDLEPAMVVSSSSEGPVGCAAYASPKSAGTTAAENKDPTRPRKYKDDLWYIRYEELLKFRDEHGHAMVPHSYPPNQKLAQWVKRYVQNERQPFFFMSAPGASHTMRLLPGCLFVCLFTSWTVLLSQATLPVPAEAVGEAFDVVR
jgi:hypothetical protein